MLSVINQAYYPLLLADATTKTCPLRPGDPATSAHNKPGLAHPLGIWGLYMTAWLGIIGLLF